MAKVGSLCNTMDYIDLIKGQISTYSEQADLFSIGQFPYMSLLHILVFQCLNLTVIYVILIFFIYFQVLAII